MAGKKVPSKIYFLTIFPHFVCTYDRAVERKLESGGTFCGALFENYFSTAKPLSHRP